MNGQRDVVLVARIGKPHGLRGEVSVQVHTDSPDERFSVGARFPTDPPERGPLVLVSVRVHQGRYLLGFEGAASREDAEQLRGTRLFVPVDGPGGQNPDDVSADHVSAASEEEFYEDELVGLSVRLLSGDEIGRVSALHTRPAQDLLEVLLHDGGTALVPFVEQLVPTVDVAAGVVVIDPPTGLLDSGV